MDAYSAALDETRKFLLRKARTAAEVSEKFGISRVAAYERLERLRVLGYAMPVIKTRGPAGKTGPKAWDWRAI